MEPAEPTCTVVLADGTPCRTAPLVGRYCEDHQSVAASDLEIFKLLSDHFQQDLREFWQRSNFYLVVSAALVSVFSAQSQDDLRLAIGSFGLIISAFWFLVARGSLVWIQLWRRELQDMDEIVDRRRVFSRSEANVSRHPWQSPSWVTQWLPAVFGLGWVAIIAASEL
jgi:hypothetical protein